MKIGQTVCGLAAMAATLALAGAASAQEHGKEPLSGTALFNRTFGGSGLLTMFNADDSYGAIQARVGQSRSQIERANSSRFAPQDGYEDSVNAFFMPLSVLFAIPETDGKSFLKLKVTGAVSRGEENLTYSNSDLGSAMIQYIHMPTADTALALAAVFEASNVDVRHNDGSIEASGAGVRVDVMHKFTDNWGVVARGVYFWDEADTVIPAPANVDNTKESERFYTETYVVGNFRSKDLSFVPEGWVFRPRLGVVYQNTRFDATTGLGGAPFGTIGPEDEYGYIAGRLHLGKQEFRPYVPAPYFELGMDHEFTNDLNQLVDEPNILVSKIGFQMVTEGGGLLDLSYTRNDGLEGERKSQTVRLIYGVTF